MEAPGNKAHNRRSSTPHGRPSTPHPRPSTPHRRPSTPHRRHTDATSTVIDALSADMGQNPQYCLSFEIWACVARICRFMYHFLGRQQHIPIFAKSSRTPLGTGVSIEPDTDDVKLGQRCGGGSELSEISLEELQRIDIGTQGAVVLLSLSVVCVSEAAGLICWSRGWVREITATSYVVASHRCLSGIVAQPRLWLTTILSRTPGSQTYCLEAQASLREPSLGLGKDPAPMQVRCQTRRHTKPYFPIRLPYEGCNSDARLQGRCVRKPLFSASWMHGWEVGLLGKTPPWLEVKFWPGESDGLGVGNHLISCSEGAPD